MLQLRSAPVPFLALKAAYCQIKRGIDAARARVVERSWCMLGNEATWLAASDAGAAPVGMKRVPCVIPASRLPPIVRVCLLSLAPLPDLLELRVPTLREAFLPGVRGCRPPPTAMAGRGSSP